MAGLQSSKLSVRITDGNYPLIREEASARFPDVFVTGEPVADRDGPKLLVSYYPPKDETLSGYDWIHIPAAGVDRMLDGLSREGHKPVLTRTIGRMGEQMGEYCLAYSLAEFQKMTLRGAFQRDRTWWKKKAAPSHIFEKTIAILGTGSIGQGIARPFKALGARVVGYSRSGAATKPFHDVYTLKSFADQPAPDVLISALPWTAETEGLINAGIFSALKDSLFINVGRGVSVDDESLQAALEDGQVARAVLDVFATEPLPEDHWAWGHDQVTVTPHVSGLTRPQDAAETLVNHLERVISTGKLPQSEVDFARGY